jgi:twitching motility protein PilT
VNAFWASAVGLVFRRVTVGAIAIEELGLPDVVRRLSLEPRGLVLVTGPTGSGKSTTLASMVDLINRSREVHIVTIEDPIEVLHEDKLGMVNQREVRVDTGDFGAALRAAMRQDPDVILVGEMRDQETVRAAITAAETGHLVLSTLHTNDAQETVNRVIDFFSMQDQKQMRLSLAAALRGIICQRWSSEPMVRPMRRSSASTPVGSPRPSSTRNGLHHRCIVVDGQFYGMQSFDQHLITLVRDGVVTMENAMVAACLTICPWSYVGWGSPVDHRWPFTTPDLFVGELVDSLNAGTLRVGRLLRCYVGGRDQMDRGAGVKAVVYDRYGFPTCYGWTTSATFARRAGASQGRRDVGQPQRLGVPTRIARVRADRRAAVPGSPDARV